MSRKKKKKNRRESDDVEATGKNTAAPEAVAVEPAAPPEPTPTEEEAELQTLRAESAALRELVQRKQAEFENYRKRVERERADFARNAGFEIVREVLPVLDNLERALQASDSSPEEQFRAGVAIIHRQFQEILTRIGLSEVESQGRAFDPHVHEAVSRVETEEHPEGTIVEVFQKGYLFNDRLLRPAMVGVAKAPASDGDEEMESGAKDEGEVVRNSD